MNNGHDYYYHERVIFQPFSISLAGKGSSAKEKCSLSETTMQVNHIPAINENKREFLLKFALHFIDGITLLFCTIFRANDTLSSLKMNKKIRFHARMNARNWNCIEIFSSSWWKISEFSGAVNYVGGFSVSECFLRNRIITISCFPWTSLNIFSRHVSTYSTYTS